jgi:hypothetical protein
MTTFDIFSKRTAISENGSVHLLSGPRRLPFRRWIDWTYFREMAEVAELSS